MKRIFAVFLIFACAGCSDVDELLTFTIDHDSEFTIAGATPLNAPLDIITPDITTNSSQEFSNNKTRADLVKDVKLQEMKLTIIDPVSKTFSFLKSIHIYISTNSNDEIELAYMDNIVSTASSITLTTTAEKLDPYIKASSYKLRTTVVTKEVLTQDVDVKMDLKFKVTADPL